MAAPKSATNVRSTPGPSRTTVLDDLSKLHARLKEAEDQHDNGMAMLTRHDIDERLEELHRFTDPAGLASESEWGELG